MASVLPAGADLPDEVLFPNQTIPVLPENHWATESGEIWVPVDKNETVTSQLVFAVYSNLDVLFGEDVETSFFHVDVDDQNFDSDVDFDERLIDGPDSSSNNISDVNGLNRTTCLQLENGTERCTSNDDSKPHLTLNSHIISATLRPPNNDFFQIRSVQIVLRHQHPAKKEGSGQCVYCKSNTKKE